MAAKLKEEIIVLPSGVSVKTQTAPKVDWDSVQNLVEAGVSKKEVAKAYKITVKAICDRAAKFRWLTPGNTRRMKKELAIKQGSILERHGVVKDPKTAFREIWEERAARTNEKAFDIAEKALDAVLKENRAKDLIKSSSDLQQMVNVARTVTGQTQKEAEKIAQSPLNLAVLRSAG